jgi:hypothetical protein
MLKTSRFAGLCAMVWLVAAPSQAAVFGTVDNLKPGRFSVGLAPELFSPSAFLFNLLGGVGLTRQLELNLHLGFGSYDTTYFGGRMDFALLQESNSAPAITFEAGVHSTSHLGVSALLGISKYFRTFGLYTALDSNFEFLDNRVAVPFDWDIGLSVPVTSQIDLYLEGDIGLGWDSPDAMVMGVNFRF